MTSQSGSANNAKNRGTSTRSPWLRRIRSRFFFRPLIVILAFLMLPPEFGNFNFLVPKAQAAIVLPLTLPPNCAQTGGNYIIQLVCAGPVTNAPPTPGYVANILAFENESIKLYLAQNNLPNSDADVAFVYQYGRTDLRTAIRAYMELRVIDAAYLSPDMRTTAQNNAYNWFLDRLSQHEQALYQAAVTDRNSWQSNRCGYKIDTDVASAYGIHYIPCVGTIEFGTAPNKDYFLAAAKKKIYDNILIGPPGSYTAPAQPAVAGHVVFSRVGGQLRGAYVPDPPAAVDSQNPQAAAPPASKTSSSSNNPTPPAAATIFALTNVELGVLLGTVGGVVGLAGLAIGLSKIPSIAAMVTPRAAGRARIVARRNRLDKKFDESEEPDEEVDEIKEPDLEIQQTQDTGDALQEAMTNGDTLAMEDADTVAGEEALESEGEAAAEVGAEIEGEALAEAGFLATGPGIVVGIAVLLVTIVVTIVVSEAVAEASLADLDKLNADAKNNVPDILDFAQDDIGKVKLQELWTEITYPDIYSTTALPSARPTDPILIQIPEGQTTPQSTASLLVPDWNYNNWAPYLYGGWIIRSGSRTIPAIVPLPAGQSRISNYSSISPYFRFWGWDGLEYEASRFGTNFVISKGQPQDTDVVCPASGLTGVTSLPSPNNCSTWVASSVNVADVNATHVTLIASYPPAFSASTTTTELSTLTGTFDIPITATGTPAPTFSIAGSSLPPGFQLVNSAVPAPAGTANASLRFSGAQTIVGNYSVNVNATNVGGTASETFNLIVSGPTLSTPIVFCAGSA